MAAFERVLSSSSGQREYHYTKEFGQKQDFSGVPPRFYGAVQEY